MHTFDLSVGEISKMEGKASLSVKITDDKIEECKFAITEFKRFYTQAVRGKDVLAIPQLTARICGTCSNAHLLCALATVENALGITPSDQTKALRKLVQYGLYIRDHALHLYVFALPDIFGIDNILELDENKENEHQILHDTFAVKAAGNALGKTIGGRSVHAPLLTVGGFTSLPNAETFPQLVAQLEEVRPAVTRLIDIFRKCDFTLIRDIEFLAKVDSEYNFLDGEIRTTTGQTVAESEYSTFLERVAIPYSHASGYQMLGKPYMVGALARMNIGKEYLHPRTKEDAKEAIALFPSKNIYHNNLAQAIETLHAIDRAQDILKSLVIQKEEPAKIERKASTGIGVIEAPRGTLYYKLTIGNDGKATDVQIIVPTGQNQIGIEKSIYEFLAPNLDKPKEELIAEIEKIVRAYDPCMSCASHFLKVKWKKVAS